MALAIPQDPATKNMLAPATVDVDSSGENNNNVDFAASMNEDEASKNWNVSASDGEVIVNFYKDKNPDKNVSTPTPARVRPKLH